MCSLDIKNPEEIKARGYDKNISTAEYFSSRMNVHHLKKKFSLKNISEICPCLPWDRADRNKGKWF